jgi:hypothetical protein
LQVEEFLRGLNLEQYEPAFRANFIDGPILQSLTALDLSRIYAAPITRLGCLAFEGQGAFASQS